MVFSGFLLLPVGLFILLQRIICIKINRTQITFMETIAKQFKNHQKIICVVFWLKKGYRRKVITSPTISAIRSQGSPARHCPVK